MKNAELIKALRYCAEHEGCDYYIAKDCPRESTWMCGVACEQILMRDAADALEAAEKRIAELMPKEGEWIPNSPFTGNCSECGGDGNLKDKYCSSCGAKMKGGQK